MSQGAGKSLTKGKSPLAVALERTGNGEEAPIAWCKWRTQVRISECWNDSTTLEARPRTEVEGPALRAVGSLLAWFAKRWGLPRAAIHVTRVHGEPTSPPDGSGTAGPWGMIRVPSQWSAPSQLLSGQLSGSCACAVPVSSVEVGQDVGSPGRGPETARAV